MQTYLNQGQVPLSVAVYLATDHYDYIPDTISATSLIKPIRQVILPRRVPPEQAKIDVLQVVKSRMGTAIHDSLEKAWVAGHYKQAMVSLGYPQKIIDRVVVNPGYVADEKGAMVPLDPKPKLEPGAIPVYMEIRSFREIMNRTVSGKFDFVAEGRLEDFKSTSVYTYIKDTKTEDYQLQGSIYRWLNPDIITQDHMAIQFFFTDWAAGQAKSTKGYPDMPVKTQRIPLMSLDDTEDYITAKLRQYDLYKNSEEQEIPFCTDKELWRKAPVYKYYKNPNNRARSTKNFDTAEEAYTRLSDEGGKGIVVEVPGEVVACKYCSAFPVCTQKDQLIAEGSLKL